MLIIYTLVIAAVTSLGLILIIKDFLKPNKMRLLGYVMFAVTFLVHDSLLVLMENVLSVPGKCMEYIVFHIVSYLIIRYCFMGNSVKNFIWVYGANFIYQAMASIFAFFGIGFMCNFKYEGFEEITNMPIGANYILLFITTIFGVAAAKIILKMLRKRNNRVVQGIVGIMAFVGILAGAINSSVSLYIVFPIMCLALLVGMLHQDKMIKQIEKQEI